MMTYFWVIIFSLIWVYHTPMATTVSNQIQQITDISQYQALKSQLLLSNQAIEYDKTNPIVLAVHGYSATPFEWIEFYEKLQTSTPQIPCSLVTLGGHGDSYDAFEASTWQDWAQPIIDEYNALIGQGYTNIHIIGSSTGGTLLLYLLHNNLISEKIRSITLIDTIIYSKIKSLYLVPYVRPFIKQTRIQPEHNDSKHHWYYTRPTRSLMELLDLLKTIQTYPILKIPNIPLLAFQAQHDPVVDSKSLEYLKSVIPNTPLTEFIYVASKLHVFTRLRGKDPANITPNDINTQAKTFQKIYQLILRSKEPSHTQ